jgi:SpoVK/Ycf46/Vps4 family AAA+-type ATPase
MGEIAWLGLVEVSFDLLETLEVSSWDTIHLTSSTTSKAADTNESASAVTTCVLQVVPSRGCSNHEVRLHPLLEEFLSQSSEISEQAGRDESASDPEDQSKCTATVSIAPLPTMSVSLDSMVVPPKILSAWNITKIETVDLPENATVTIQCLYFEPARSDASATERDTSVSWSRALEGRIIQQGTTVALATLEGYAMVMIFDLQTPGGHNLDTSVAYRLGASDSFRVQAPTSTTLPTTTNESEQSMDSQDFEQECPGYERLLGDLVSLLSITGAAAPTGVLLTGCAGVGKTRLASCLAGTFLTKKEWRVHSVSIQDLLLRASWATEEQIFQVLLPPSRDSNSNVILIVDDLHVLAVESSEDPSTLDPERRLVYNSLLQVADKLIEKGIPILGIAHTATQLPAELTKIGRLEKEVSVPPPTQHQREHILLHMLQQTDIDSQLCRQWAEALAPTTAGCVAADIRRICADAWTRVWARTGEASASPSWSDLRDAVHRCVPSQLATLDVTKGPTFDHICSHDDWPKIHDLAWKDFAGYPEIQKRVYRTVVVPWRRRLKSSQSEATPSSTLSPPSGILFHGASGCGKTLAAQCLAASLALPMIKVRASDVLDKWLGGSEAAIRSLFSRARAAEPVILFFDEIDAIASNRATDGETSDVMARLLSTLLNEMDGVSSGRQANVVVVACTNRLDTLDAALLRPGRLEEHVLLQEPTARDAANILRLNLARARLQDNVDLESIGTQLVSTAASCADVEGISRAAVMVALRRASVSTEVSISNDDFSDAMDALKVSEL